VCIFPVERGAWVDYGGSPRRIRRVQPNQTNAYNISGVPAGEYFVVAVADDRSADWRDPRHLDALSRIASRVTFADEEAKTLDLSAQRTPATSPSAAVALGAVGPFVADAADSEPSFRSGPFDAEEGELQQTPPRAVQRAMPQPTGSGSITGVITTGGASPTPVRRVIVLLNSTDPKVGHTTLTDDAGRFEFASLPAGRC
jgi:hypothetical protein